MHSDEDDDETASSELVDTEERVQESLQGLRTVASVVTITSQPTDTEEEVAVSTFMSTGCRCHKVKGASCYRQFSLSYVEEFRASCSELTPAELDMVIMGQLAAAMNTSETVSTTARHKDDDREKCYTSFSHQGKPVCVRIFRFLHRVGERRLKNLTKSLKCNGLRPRVHGNTNMRPKHALSFSSTEYVVRFLFSYAEQHALLLPGRVPGYSRDDLQLLPSSTSKWSVWKVYHEAAEAEGTIHPVAYTTFCYLWRTLVPSVVVMKPRSDLCWQCQQNSAAIVHMANGSEAEKTTTISDALEHLRVVKMETDEVGDCGKGANAVISRLDFFFDHHGFGEKDVFLHADNCTGQNKNNCMVQYLVWRVITKRHTNITLSFLPVGHTKFSPDWCFGLFKRQYRRMKVGSLQNIAEIVNTSAECNVAQLVSREDGSTIVPTLDWTDFFATKMKKIQGIKKLHHFCVTSSSPGHVFVKERSDTAERDIDLLKELWTPDEDAKPDVIPPKGLSHNRQWYLYEQIRPFCPPDDQDSVCPLPSVPRPGGSKRGTPHPEEALPDPDPPASPPPPKRQRTCGICHAVGHDRRSCPDK